MTAEQRGCGEQGVAKIAAPKEEKEGWVELKGREKLQSKGIVQYNAQWFQRMNESKELGRAKNSIRDVQCSGFVRVEQQVCLTPMAANSADSFESPWRLTAQMASKAGNSADPVGINRARPVARRGKRKEERLVRSQTKSVKTTHERCGPFSLCRLEPNVSHKVCS